MLACGRPQARRALASVASPLAGAASSASPSPTVLCASRLIVNGVGVPLRRSSSAIIRDDAQSGSRPVRLAASLEHGASSPKATDQSSEAVLSAQGQRQQSRRFGQPLPHSHPHLFPKRYSLLGGAEPYPPNEDGQTPYVEDELTPGIPASEYEQRRRRLMDMLPEKSIVICMAGRIKTMSGSIFYRFRQDSNFLYLTGFQEPDSAVVLEKNSSERGYRMTMFVQPRDPANEVWNGPRTGLDGATQVFGADEAIAMEPSAFVKYFKDNLPAFDQVYVDPPQSPTVPRQSGLRRQMPSLLNFLAPPSPTPYDNFPRKADFEALLKLFNDPLKCKSLSEKVHALRLIKSDNELRLMRQAGRVGSKAMSDVMAVVRPNMSEWQLQSTFEASCASLGAQRPAYVPVVASGTNALTIHYVQNDDICRKDELVCMDAGCELDGYVSDITRAFPVSGRFSSAQRDLYEAVLTVLKACTKLAREDYGYTLSGLHRRSVEMLNGELKQLGFNLAPGSLERDIYPHALSHWLGLDLHDTSTIDRSTQLRHGMCLSVEPAVYCQEGTPGVPHHFWGIGIRIEDDVALYGKDANLILNAESPRECQDVEATCMRFFEQADGHAPLLSRDGQPWDAQKAQN